MPQLFSKYDIFGVIEGTKRRLADEVDRLEANYLLNSSEEDLVRAIASEHQLDVPVLDLNGVHTLDFQETKIEAHRSYLNGWQSGMVKGVKITIAVPFEGNSEFFDVRPSSYIYGGEMPDYIEIGPNQLQMIYVRADNDGEALKRSYQAYLTTLNQNMTSLSQSAREFNSALEAQVRQLIQRRKQGLDTYAKMATSLGLPIKRRQDMPATFAVPVQKRSPKIARPIASTSKIEPEPFLEMQEYENILAIIRSMVRVMEQSPKAFDGMEEEDLRTHFLVQLNGQYEGRATGETFNFQGKTDILIREGDRNVFIAECKFWRGEKQFHETIDQLLSYLSWGDTKVAILVFNRNANFSDVLNKIDEAVPKHKNWKRALGKIGESTFRYIFHQNGDANRALTLSVLAFDVPTSAHRSK